MNHFRSCHKINDLNEIMNLLSLEWALKSVVLKRRSIILFPYHEHTLHWINSFSLHFLHFCYVLEESSRSLRVVTTPLLFSALTTMVILPLFVTMFKVGSFSWKLMTLAF